MRFRSGAMALTICGWTPGLRQIVAGRLLACGCLVGVYEMRTGGCVEILDGRCDSCGDLQHKVNRVLHAALSEHITDMRFASVTRPENASDEDAPHDRGGTTRHTHCPPLHRL